MHENRQMATDNNNRNSNNNNNNNSKNNNNNNRNNIASNNKSYTHLLIIPWGRSILMNEIALNLYTVLYNIMLYVIYS